MAHFIILRLVPTEPVDEQFFRDEYLNKDGTPITVEVLDASFATLNPNDWTTPLGAATYTTSAPSDDEDSWLFQHRRAISGFPPIVIEFRAVATAALSVTLPDPEFKSADIRIRVRRGTNVIAQFAVDFNVTVTGDLDPPDAGDDRAQFFQELPAAAYLTLPEPATEPALGDEAVTLPADGSPPNFLDLKEAVVAVLQADPEIGSNPADVEEALATLTPEESRHVAYELVWNRAVSPLPAVDSETVEHMYTTGETGGGSGDETARQQFEAALIRQRIELNAHAELLGKYVFALGAAVACERLSRGALRAGLRFPIRPAQLVPTAGKIMETEVSLKNP
jgi:hypothetical protein